MDASYAGDGNNNAADDQAAPAEQVTVSPASPTISTTPSPTAVTLCTTRRSTLTDTATLSGGYNATGHDHLHAVPMAASVVDTETVTVSGNGSYTTPTGYTLPTTGTVTGTYQWDASYSGDTNNNAGQRQQRHGRAGDGEPGQPDDRHHGESGDRAGRPDDPDGLGDGLRRL